MPKKSKVPPKRLAPLRQEKPKQQNKVAEGEEKPKIKRIRRRRRKRKDTNDSDNKSST